MTANSEIVRTAILAQNAHDDDTLAAALDPAIEWHTQPPGGEPTTITGREAFLAAVRQAREEYGEFRVTLHDLQEHGDAVLVAGSVSAEKGLRMPRAWIWWLRDGLAVRVDSFAGRDQAKRIWDRDVAGDR